MSLWCKHFWVAANELQNVGVGKQWTKGLFHHQVLY